MNLLLRMYPGDAWAILAANVLVQATVVIFAARLVARLGSRWNAAWRHSIYWVALLCVLASPILSTAMQASGFTLLTLHSSSHSAPTTEPTPTAVVPMPDSEVATISPPAEFFSSRPEPETETLAQAARFDAPAAPAPGDSWRNSPRGRWRGDGHLALGDDSIGGALVPWAVLDCRASAERSAAGLHRAGGNSAASASSFGRSIGFRRWPPRPAWIGRSWSG